MTAETGAGSVVKAGPASLPVVFDGTVGLFSPAEGDAKPVAVLFASPWGLEELCVRKFFRILADTCAQAGIASLRFDYPGTGDALDFDLGSANLATWTDSLVSSAHQLKQLSGCDRLVVVTQGIGAVIATHALERIEGVEAVAFLAPVVSGRFYLREMQVLARMIDERLNITTKPESDRIGMAVGGMSMPRGITDDLKRVDLMKLERFPVSNSIVFERPDRPSDSAFADHLRAIGVNVRQSPFSGYERLTLNPMLAVVPQDVVRELVDWVAGFAPAGSPANALRMPALQPHGGEGFWEQPIRFGAGERLYGILCRPGEGVIQKPVTALLLSAGYDRASGWGRLTTELARKLAAHGIVSLRFDGASVADSLPWPGFDGQVLYDPRQFDDVRDAADVLEQEAPHAAIIAAGRCSGAYLALQQGWSDSRIRGVAAVNAAVYEWPVGRPVDDALAHPTQSIKNYRESLLRSKTFKRLLRGEVDLRNKGMQALKGLAGRGFSRLLHLVGSMTKRERIVVNGFTALSKRAVPVRLLYSPGDVGLDEFNHFFGSDGARIRRYPNMTWEVVPESDHNFTPAHARERYLETVLEIEALIEKDRAEKAAR